MVEVEVFERVAGFSAPPASEVLRLCASAAERRGVSEGHVAVEFVDSARITELNREHRGRALATDVLSFPIDGLPGAGAAAAAARPGDGVTAAGGEQEPPVELGDIVICPEHTADIREAIVHGMLHLLGMDHETDSGEMLALQAELLAPGR
jgi:probable rRNA maturation factor